MCKSLNYIFPLLLLAIVIHSCKKWDDHINVNNPALNGTVMQEIAKRAELSKFNEYLLKTGLDKLLNTSKTFTVWAPTNTALQTLDAATIADTARLKQFLSNHISNQAYYSSGNPFEFRVPLINGKRMLFSNKKYDEANITAADIVSGNGVLHVIDKAVAPLPSVWDFVNSTSGQFKQNAFINQQVYKMQDLSNAVIDSISSTTGQPIYKPGSDSVSRNRFNDQVFNLKNEEKLYTYFVLNDTAFQSATESLKAYYKTSTTDSTSSLAAWNVAKDAIVEGIYSVNQIPDTLISKFGVKFHVDKNAIIETRRVSNGIVYVLSKLDVKPQDKLPSFIIQGEQPTSFYPGLDRRSVTFYRARKNPQTNQVFQDIMMNNHGTAMYYIRYRINAVPSAKYKVYWVAVNDFQTTTFTQRLAMGTLTNTTFPYVTVPLNNYNEVLLGEYTMNSYGSLDMFLTAANSAANGANSLVLDYIKLVPAN